MEIQRKYFLIFLIPFFLLWVSFRTYAIEVSTESEQDTEINVESETVCETIETERESLNEAVNREKKPLTAEAVWLVLGGEYWLLSEEQLQILDEAGYDVSEFYQIQEPLNKDVMLLGFPKDYGGVKLTKKGFIFWGNTMDDRLFLFGGNSYWNQGTYVQIYTLHRKGSYDGDERDAYCLNPMVNESSQGEIDAYEISNENLLKVYYYGFGGPGYSAEIANIYSQVDPYYSAFYHGSDEAYYVLTHCLAALAYEDANWAYGLSQSAADTVMALWTHIQTLPSPNETSDITFSQPEGTYAFLNANGCYECPTIYVNGNTEAYIEYEVPEGTTLYMGDGTHFKSGEKVKLYGGTSFCLTAEEDDVHGTYKAEYTGKVVKYRALVAFGNDLQDVGWMNKYITDGTKTSIQVDWPEAYTVKITLTKTIRAEDINFDNGNPMFTFKIDGSERSGQKRTCYAIVDFTEEYVKNHTDTQGNVSLSVVFENLKPGIYEASELITSRYEQKNISDITNGVKNADKVCFTLNSSKKKEGSACFTNENYEHRNYSDTQKMINHLSAD